MHQRIGDARLGELLERILSIAAVVQIGIVRHLGAHLLGGLPRRLEPRLGDIPLVAVHRADRVGAVADQRARLVDRRVAGRALGLE